MSQRLAAAGYDIREVPTRRTAERRRARRRAKSDQEDAFAIARATAGEPGLGPVKQPAEDAVLGELAAVRRHRDLLVQRRTMMLNHAEAVLVALPRSIADALPRGRAVQPRLAAAVAIDSTAMPAAVRSDVDLLRELAADIGEVSARVKTLERRLGQLVKASDSTLSDEVGIGIVAAATLLVEIGNPSRFRSESAFNRWWGGAPVAVSSGEGDGQPVRHRLDRLGNRTVNSTLHIMSVTQACCHEPAQDHLARKRREGATAREARRAHKTHLGRRIIRRMWADQQRAKTPAPDALRSPLLDKGASATRTELPAAVRVLDAIHVVRLGFQALDEVRRRVQQDTLGHCGHKHDPLYRIRNLLRHGAEYLTDRQVARLDAALAAGDPDWQVTIAWQCYQQLRSIYHPRSASDGATIAAKVLDAFPSCPIPEVARLGRTLRAWRSQLMAYFVTERISNGGTEAINLIIEKTRRLAHGFRNFGNYRLRLLLVADGRRPYPRRPPRPRRNHA